MQLLHFISQFPDAMLFLAERAVEGFWVFDPKTEEIYVNKSLRLALGYSKNSDSLSIKSLLKNKEIPKTLISNELILPLEYLNKEKEIVQSVSYLSQFLKGDRVCVVVAVHLTKKEVPSSRKITYDSPDNLTYTLEEIGQDWSLGSRFKNQYSSLVKSNKGNL